MALLLGTARADITPPWPVPLAGFAFRAERGPARRVARPLRLRVLAFGEPAPDRVAAVFVSADLIWWGSSLAARLRRTIAGRYEIPPSAVFLHATHGHSGPQTAEDFTALLGEPDQRYLAHLGNLTLAAVADAANTMRPVSVERALGRCTIGINRRGGLATGPVLRPDPTGPVDRELIVLRFSSATGRTEALLVHFACHPVVTGANVVSSDFSGAAMDRLERDLPVGSVALYAQGCCGDVNPGLLDGDGFRLGGEPEVAQFGHRLVAAVRTALASDVVRLGPPRIASAETTAELPLAPLPSTDELRAKCGEPGVVGQWARRMLDCVDRLRPTIEVRLSALRLTDETILLGFGAEPTTAYGRYVKTAYKGRVIPLGYTNGMFGYLVSDAEAAAGGYEAVDAPRYFGMPAPLAPGAEQHTRDAVDRLLAPWTPADRPAKQG